MRLSGRWKIGGLFAGLFLLLGLVMSTEKAQASDAASIGLELNKLEPTDSGCRAYMVLRNPSDVQYEKFNLELLVFDTDGVIQKRLSVPFSPLRADKTAVNLFDISMQCESIGEILLNDFFDCETDQGSVVGCLDLVTLTSKATARFYK